MRPMYVVMLEEHQRGEHTEPEIGCPLCSREPESYQSRTGTPGHYVHQTDEQRWDAVMKALGMDN